MAMTERQGGSDVRANLTEAEPIGDGEYLLCSGNIMCLDVLRAATKSSEALNALLDGLAGQGEPRIAAVVARLRERFADPSGLEADLRHKDLGARPAIG